MPTPSLDLEARILELEQKLAKYADTSREVHNRNVVLNQDLKRQRAAVQDSLVVMRREAELKKAAQRELERIRSELKAEKDAHTITREMVDATKLDMSGALARAEAADDFSTQRLGEISELFQQADKLRTTLSDKASTLIERDTRITELEGGLSALARQLEDERTRRGAAVSEARASLQGELDDARAALEADRKEFADEVASWRALDHIAAAEEAQKSAEARAASSSGDLASLSASLAGIDKVMSPLREWLSSTHSSGSEFAEVRAVTQRLLRWYGDAMRNQVLSVMVDIVTPE